MKPALASAGVPTNEFRLTLKLSVQYFVIIQNSAVGIATGYGLDD
jgi:hypothetical protein